MPACNRSPSLQPCAPLGMFEQARPFLPPLGLPLPPRRARKASLARRGLQVLFHLPDANHRCLRVTLINLEWKFILLAGFQPPSNQMPLLYRSALLARKFILLAALRAALQSRINRCYFIRRWGYGRLKSASMRILSIKFCFAKLDSNYQHSHSWLRLG